MFDKLHLLSQDVPDGGQGVRWRKHPYLRITAGGAKGPAVFDWNERQRQDLEALWRDPAADGARERLARDLAAFCDKLGWKPDAKLLEDTGQCGEEYILTLSAVPPELYLLPWEVIQVGASGKYLSPSARAEGERKPPTLVDSNVINAYRISGSSQIEPDNNTKNQMRFDDVTSVLCIIKLTISASGRVVDATILKKSGYDDYDRTLRAAVLTWTYRPYKPDGIAIPVSSTVHFAYTAAE